MTRYYVTTGTSLSESRCWFARHEAGPPGQPKPNPKRFNRFDDPRWGKLLTLIYDMEEHGEDLDADDVLDFIRTERDRSRRFHIGRADCPITESMNQTEAEQAARETVEQYFDAGCWQNEKRHLLPAELATILAMSLLGTFREGDTIEFIGGESNKAETVLSTAVLRHVASATTGGFAFEPAGITCSYQRELDPQRHADFQRGIDQLWRGTILKDGSTDFRLVLTGGYKGTGLALAARIESHATKFYYMHEDAGNTEQDNYGIIVMDIEDGRTK